jgi:hypothetical protein
MIFMNVPCSTSYSSYLSRFGARGREVDWGTMLEAERSQGSIPDEVIRFFNLPNSSSRTMSQLSTRPLKEMNIRNLPAG